MLWRAALFLWIGILFFLPNGAGGGGEDLWLHSRPSQATLEFLGTTVTTRTMHLYDSTWMDFLRRTGLGGWFETLSNDEQDCAVAHYLAV